MQKNNTELRLAERPGDWKSLTAEACQMVDEVTGHGEQDKADSLFSLLTLLTDTRINASDRECLGFDVLTKVFGQTTAGAKALETEMRRVNPALASRRAA